jgi:multidrug efflux pump
VGGLLFAGILTLFVIPAVYSYFSRKAKTIDDDSNEIAASSVAPSLQHETVLS